MRVNYLPFAKMTYAATGMKLNQNSVYGQAFQFSCNGAELVSMVIGVAEGLRHKKMGESVRGHRRGYK